MGLINTLITDLEVGLGLASTFAGAVPRFRLESPTGYNIPKPKFMYYVNFVSTHVSQQTLKQISYFVKRTDRLQVNYELQEMNEYNKKRIVQTKLSYQPFTITLHDTISGDAVKFIQAYNQFYYGDFLSKNNTSWIYDTTSANFEVVKPWGLMANQPPSTANFIDRIELYEIYNQVYSQINFINPKIQSFDMQPMNSEESAGSEITTTFRFEGAVYQAVAQPVTQAIATLVGIPYTNNFLTGLIGGLNIPGFDIGAGFGLPGQSLLSTAAVGLNNAFPGTVSSSTFSAVNSLLNGNTPSTLTQNVPYQTGSGIFQGLNGGSTPSINFSPLSSTAGILPSVSNQVNAGVPVTGVSTGQTSLFSSIGSIF